MLNHPFHKGFPASLKLTPPDQQQKKQISGQDTTDVSGTTATYAICTNLTDCLSTRAETGAISADITLTGIQWNH